MYVYIFLPHVKHYTQSIKITRNLVKYPQLIIDKGLISYSIFRDILQVT